MAGEVLFLVFWFFCVNGRERGSTGRLFFFSRRFCFPGFTGGQKMLDLTLTAPPSNLPNLGPHRAAPTRPNSPPAMCTTVPPAKSNTGQRDTAALSHERSPQTQWTRSGWTRADKARV